MTNETERDVIVVGGGIAGLTAAIMMARAGLRVRVDERTSAAGGRARSIDRNGFQFEFGAHALYRGGSAMATLRELGITPRGITPSLDRALVVEGDVVHRMPSTISTMLTTSAIGLRAKLRLLRLFAGLRRPTDPALATLSVSQWLDQEVDDPQLRRLLVALIGLSTYCRQPDRLSADSAREQLRIAVAGVLYLDGGWGQLATALEELARSEGVELALGGGVEAIERRGDRWHVHSSAGEQQASQLLLALPPASAGKLLREAGIEPSWVSPEPQRAACLDIGLLGPWTEPDVVLDLAAPIYMTVQSNYGARAPSGCCLVSTIWYRRPEDDALPPDAIRAGLEAAIDRWIPDRVTRTLEQQYLPDMMVAGDLPRPEQGGLAGRASIEPEPERAPGVWVAGDWVGSRGMIGDAALASASAAARSIIARRRQPIRRSA